MSRRNVDRRLEDVDEDSELIDRSTRPVRLSPALVREKFGDSRVAELSDSVAELSDVADLYRSEAQAYRDDNERLRLQAERDIASRLRVQVESLQRELAQSSERIAEMAAQRDALKAALHTLTSDSSQ